MSPIDDEKLEELLERWAEREERAAPELHAPEDLRRRVAARARRPHRSLWRWAAAAAVLFALFAVGRRLYPPGGSGPSEAPFELVAWAPEGEVDVDGPRLMVARSQRKGPAFEQLLFQYRRVGASGYTSVDAYRPPEERIELAAGDGFRVGLQPSGERYVYLFAAGAEFGAKRLFPVEAPPVESTPAPAPQAFYVPAEPNWLEAKGGQGRVRILALAARAPLPELDNPTEGVLTRLEALASDPPPGVELVEIAFDRR